MKRRPNTHGYLTNDAYARKTIRQAVRKPSSIDDENLSDEDKKIVADFKNDPSPKNLREVEKRGLTKFI